MPKSKRLLTLFFLSTFCVTSSVLSMEEFFIERNSQDSFTIPNSICANDTESQCQSMGGHQDRGTSSQTRCKCECSLKKVFGFFNDTWKCERNHDVRTFFAQGCFHPPDKDLDSPIDTVPAFTWRQVIATSVLNSCHLNRNFTYLDCNGEWQQIQDAHNGFVLNTGILQPYFLRSLEETKFDDFSPSIRGKIITLRISCYRKDYCVVLKVRGKLKCPFINPTTVKPTSQYSGTVGNQSGKDNSGVIGGAIGGVIILLVAVVLIVLVVAIRRKRAANIGIQPETSHSALDNPSYKRGEGHVLTLTSHQDDQEVNPYSYARHADQAIASDTYVQANDFSTDTKERRDQFQGTLEESNIEEKKEKQLPLPNEPHYNVLEHISFPVSPSDYEVPVSNRQVSNDGEKQSSHDIHKVPSSSFEENRSSTYPLSNQSNAPVYNTLEDPDYQKLQRSQDIYSVPSNNAHEPIPTIQGRLSQGSPPDCDAPVYNILEDPDYEKLQKSQDMYSVPFGSKPTVDGGQTPSSSLSKPDAPVYSSAKDPDCERLRESSTSSIKVNQPSAGPPPSYKAPVYNTLYDPDYEKLKISQGIYNVPSNSTDGSKSTFEEGQSVTGSSPNSPFYSTLDNPDYEKLKISQDTCNSGNDSKSTTEEGRTRPGSSSNPNSPIYSSLDPDYEKVNDPTPIQEGRSSSGTSPNYDAPVYRDDGHYKRLQRSQGTFNAPSNVHESKVVNQEDMSPASPVYSTPEDVHHYEKVHKLQDMHERPSYNVLERPETKWKTNLGPVYEVPKEPSFKDPIRNPVRSEYSKLEHPTNRKSAQSKEMQSESSYHVLDRPETRWASKKRNISEEPPKSSGGPVYEVI